MPVSIDRRTGTTFVVATILTVLSAPLYSAVAGFDDEALKAILRYSGRIAFVFLIIVFAARPLQELLHSRWTAQLLRNRRQLGVAFAGIHVGHLILIGVRVHESPELDLVDILSVSGVVIYTVILAMLITSFTGPARRLGRRAWNILHTVGLYILFMGFLLSQVPDSPEQTGIANLALITLAAIALALRVSAFFRRRRTLQPL
jgi:sulfoxide reductase heme-binding subunit YedZ